MNDRAVAEVDKLLADKFPSEDALPAWMRSAARILATGICIICNCTDTNACVDEFGPCSWINDEQNVCSACARFMLDPKVNLDAVNEDDWQTSDAIAFFKQRKQELLELIEAAGLPTEDEPIDGPLVQLYTEGELDQFLRRRF